MASRQKPASELTLRSRVAGKTEGHHSSSNAVRAPGRTALAVDTPTWWGVIKAQNEAMTREVSRSPTAVLIRRAAGQVKDTPHPAGNESRNCGTTFYGFFLGPPIPSVRSGQAHRFQGPRIGDALGGDYLLLRDSLALMGTAISAACKGPDEIQNWRSRRSTKQSAT